MPRDDVMRLIAEHFLSSVHISLDWLTFTTCDLYGGMRNRHAHAPIMVAFFGTAAHAGNRYQEKRHLRRFAGKNGGDGNTLYF